MAITELLRIGTMASARRPGEPSIAYQLTHRSKHAAVHRPAFRWANGRHAATLIEFHTLASAKDLSMNTFGFSFPWSYGVQLLSGDSLAFTPTPTLQDASLNYTVISLR
jgi:hypothetical protein